MDDRPIQRSEGQKRRGSSAAPTLAGALRLSLRPVATALLCGQSEFFEESRDLQVSALGILLRGLSFSHGQKSRLGSKPWFSRLHGYPLEVEYCPHLLPNYSQPQSCRPSLRAPTPPQIPQQSPSVGHRAPTHPHASPKIPKWGSPIPKNPHRNSLILNPVPKEIPKWGEFHHHPHHPQLPSVLRPPSFAERGCLLRSSADRGGEPASGHP